MAPSPGARGILLYLRDWAAELWPQSAAERDTMRTCVTTGGMPCPEAFPAARSLEWPWALP